LYISAQKFFPYAERVDVLGHIIDDDGIHADIDKMAKIRSWGAPSDYNAVLRFLGLVEYVSAFMPDVSKWTSVLQGMCSGGRPFEWRAIHQKCFDEIRRTAIRAPILKPINWESIEPIWVVTDACPAGMVLERFPVLYLIILSFLHSFYLFSLSTSLSYYSLASYISLVT